MIFVVLLLHLLGNGDATRKDYVATISPKAYTHWGSWGHIDWCPLGQYAYGLQLKAQVYQGSGLRKDDTAVNGILLYCKDGSGSTGHVTSKVMSKGNWRRSRYCPGNVFLNGVCMKSEPEEDKKHFDNTAVNDFIFVCEPPWQTILPGGGLTWGNWRDSVHCPKNSVICGIQTLVQDLLEGTLVDNTALNGVRFPCCRNPKLGTV